MLFRPFSSQRNSRKVTTGARGHPTRSCWFEPLEQRRLLAAFDLGNYEKNTDIDLNLAGTTLDDYSGVAYSDATDSLFIVDNQGSGKIVKYTKDGSFQSLIDMDNFSDPEAIIHLGGDRFAVIEEKDRTPDQDAEEFHISIFSIVGGGDIDKHALSNDLPNEGVIVLTHVDLNDGSDDNKGPEGLAYDPVGGYFYFAKEKEDLLIFRVPETGGTVELVSIPGITLPGDTLLGDVSDIYFVRTADAPDGRLFLLSDDSAKILMADLDATGLQGTVVEDGGVPIELSLPTIDYEGITFTPDSFEMTVVLDGATRHMIQYRNFTVLTPGVAPDMTAGSDTGTSDTDNITSDTTPTFTGTLERTVGAGSVPVENATVRLYVDGAETASTAETDANGDYTITAPALSDGEHQITIKAGENTGTAESNRSLASPALGIVIDTVNLVEPVSLFSDGFESGNFTAGGWTTSGDAKVVTKLPFSGSFTAKIKKVAWIEKAVSTVGFQDIHVKYARKTKGFDAGEFLVVEWYDGSIWRELESTQDTSWAAQDVTLPSDADNQSGFRVRFRTNTNREEAYIDAVEIIGIALGPTIPQVGVTITQTGGSTDVTEGGATDTYSLVLDTEPTATVTVSVDPDAQIDLGLGAGAAITLTFTPADWDTPQPVMVTAVDDALDEGSHTGIITHSAAGGNYDGVAILNVTANITDNDAPPPPPSFTKFFVVDTAVDDTFEYEADGTPVTNYDLAAGNTDPRGATSNVTGTTVWVIDKDKTVYVYDTSGGFQGSWIATGIRTPEGIATDGTHIWILDGKAKRIFFYESAAAVATSGTVNPTSSFALDGSNTKAKGITTDGSSIWVVNDNKTDVVFKYDTTNGKLLGSWIIDGANAKPTGITIDPSGVSDIWIADSGTDQVFQYTAAAGRTSDSQAADAVFNLAAANTNPQGIADPPPRLSPTVTSTAPAVVAKDDFETVLFSDGSRRSSDVRAHEQFFERVGRRDNGRRAGVWREAAGSRSASGANALRRLQAVAVDRALHNEKAFVLRRRDQVVKELPLPQSDSEGR